MNKIEKLKKVLKEAKERNIFQNFAILFFFAAVFAGVTLEPPTFWQWLVGTIWWVFFGWIAFVILKDSD